MTEQPAEEEPRKRQPGERREYDWPGLRRMYVEGDFDNKTGLTHWPTLDEISAKLDLTPQRVRERSSREGWVAARKAWQTQTQNQRQAARAGALAKTAQELDTKAIDASKLGMQLVYARLSEVGQNAQAQRALTAGQPGGANSGIDAKEQESLARALDLWYKIGRKAVGDPDVTRIEVTGAGGGPVDISAELRRDDPDRLAAVVAIMEQVGIKELADLDWAEGVIDGELADDPEAGAEAGRREQ